MPLAIFAFIELINYEGYRTQEDARADVFDYIVRFCIRLASIPS